MSRYEFSAELWLWDARRSDTWTFVTLPESVSEAVADDAAALGPRRGFGSVRVEVDIGGSHWSTSVFPDAESGCYVLPVKKAVRIAESLEAGDTATVGLRVV